jgi:hypothetical protein
VAWRVSSTHGPDWVWAMRASASVKDGPNDPHRAQRLKHFTGRTKGKAVGVGRMLLGLAPV